MDFHGAYLETGLITAIEAVLAGGEVLRAHWPMARQVQEKGFRDWVTSADLAAQEAILAVIRRHGLGHRSLAEEEGEGISEAGEGMVWVVDPLDGTTNFARRFPCFSVSVGLLVDGEPMVGAIYDPLKDMLFTAVRGRGAFLNGQPIRTSGTEQLERALIGLDWGRRNETRKQALGWLSRLAMQCQTVRAIGSTALGMAYVAAGWLDLYFHLAPQPWDVAAAAVIVREAHGALYQPDGSPWSFGSQGVIVSNGRLEHAVWAALGLETKDSVSP
ncbi:MAG: inositol monophosphatase family protein [Anaerolineae bacterium]|nr:inositol monophosphatase [Thermoflexus sp.]MDW8064982.1 inositol monophosphatase family protein [Anaerolineae bacterium]